MKRIISVSRRTDVPAFYGDWFMGRLKEGFVGVLNPYGGQKYIVSLRPEDVSAIVFWSKNFGPFMKNLEAIERMGYRFYFNCTVTALPDVFEERVDKRSAIEALKRLSRMYSAKHINWRFDPVIISSICDRAYYVRRFERLACELAGDVERCFFSFVTEYGKVKRNFDELERTAGVRVIRATDEFKIELANELAEIAASYGIRLFSCCGDYLVGGRVGKAHCIDGAVIEELFYPKVFSYSLKPTRQQCGCTESTDIGAYDTCPHGCVYCYANAETLKVRRAYKRHEVESAFLGCGKSESDVWLGKIGNGGTEEGCGQLELCGDFRQVREKRSCDKRLGLRSNKDL